jgi:hypothetical protein
MPAKFGCVVEPLVQRARGLLRTARVSILSAEELVLCGNDMTPVVSVRRRELRREPLRACAWVALVLVCACQSQPVPAVSDAAAAVGAATVTALAAHRAPSLAPTVAPLVAPRPAASAAESPLTDEELAFFDRLVADEILFPRPAERARYERQEPETIKNQLHVGFELKQQPGMKKGRHFHLVDVAVARAGTYVTRRKEPKLKGSAGPNGSSIEFAAQTPDGAYDIRVSQGMLLVRPVKAPEFDPERVATALVDRYVALRADGSRVKTN